MTAPLPTLRPSEARYRRLGELLDQAMAHIAEGERDRAFGAVLACVDVAGEMRLPSEVTDRIDALNGCRGAFR